MNKKVCLICGEEKDGIPIKEDRIVQFIRKVKRRLNVEKGYTIVVCNSCLKEYVKRRKQFEKYQLYSIILSVVLFVLFMILMLSSGRFSVLGLVRSFVYSLLLGLFLFVISYLNYIPELEVPLDELESRIGQKSEETSVEPVEGEEAAGPSKGKETSIPADTTKSGKKESRMPRSRRSGRTSRGKKGRRK